MTERAPTFSARMTVMMMTCLTFVFVYNLTNWITSLRLHRGVAAFAWEQKIPFVPLFIIPYWSIDLFFIFAPWVISSDHELRVFRRRIVTAVVTAGTCFLLFPLELQFHRPPVTGMLGVLFGSLENLNNFWNLAPSLHIALRTVLWPVYLSRVSGVSSVLLRSWFVAIGASTLLCWQHHVVDVFTGQLLGLTVGAIFPVWRVPQGDAARDVTPRHRRLGAIYGSAGVVLLGVTAILVHFGWLAAIVLLWPVLALGLFGAAYRLGAPWILGKNPETGTIAPGTQILLLPVTAGARWVQRRYTRADPPMYRLTERVHFGRRPIVREQKVEVRTIVDLTAEFPSVGVPGADVVAIPLLDLVPPPVSMLIAAAEQIARAESEGTVFVHCALGRGRSAIAVAAWLLSAKRADSVESACEAVRRCSPHVILKESEQQRLREFIERTENRVREQGRG